MLLYFARTLVFVSCAKLLQASEQCEVTSLSVYSHQMTGHVISVRKRSSLSECLMLCSHELRCKSINFRLNDKSCDLNDADRFTHPEDYGPKEGFVYMDSERHKQNHGFKSCAEISQTFPQAHSGYYWLKIGKRDAQVYCDMDNYGGGWTLVVSISSLSNDHLQSNSNNCLNSVLCVPAYESAITARKLSDRDIHKLAMTEGTFRVDVMGGNAKYSIFYQIPSGPGNFDSSCAGGRCPRIIISGLYPYQWETNNCTTLNKGYSIANGCYRGQVQSMRAVNQREKTKIRNVQYGPRKRVFDGHDNHECRGSTFWQSSSYRAGRRALYGYPCPKDPNHDSFGIYHNRDGLLYVK